MLREGTGVRVTVDGDPGQVHDVRSDSLHEFAVRDLVRGSIGRRIDRTDIDAEASVHQVLLKGHRGVFPSCLGAQMNRG
jgi:hypothetical protein